MVSPAVPFESGGTEVVCCSTRTLGNNRRRVKTEARLSVRLPNPDGNLARKKCQYKARAGRSTPNPHSTYGVGRGRVGYCSQSQSSDSCGELHFGDWAEKERKDSEGESWKRRTGSSLAGVQTAIPASAFPHDSAPNTVLTTANSSQYPRIDV